MDVEKIVLNGKRNVTLTAYTLLNSSSSIISPFGQMIIRAGMLSQDILPLADVAHAETR